MSGLPIYLLIPTIAWLVAQISKEVVARVKGGASAPRRFFRSGSMPSAHSATLLALLTAVGVREGIESVAFGIVGVMTAVVLYDAVNVRRAVGEQGKVLQTLSKGVSFFSAEGHRLTEVVAGSIIGVVVALVLLQIL